MTRERSDDAMTLDEVALGSTVVSDDASDGSQRSLGIRALESLVRNLAAGFLSLVVIVVLVGVVARYVLNISLPWSEEVARLLLVWLTFLGAAAATAQRSHIRVDTIYARFSGRRRKVIEATSILLSLLTLVLLIWASRGLFGPSAATVSPGSGIQAGWTRIALPIAAFLMIVFLLIQLRDVVRGRQIKDESDIAYRDEV
ncbi:MAG: TRAP transporter small permease [Chloroflexota bacterium]|nr:TRAP transporter small permease [Chloroflexota bacterium]